MSERVCQGCGTELPESVKYGRPRKWCSGRCRKKSYGQPCIDCGTRTTFGSQRGRVREPRCQTCGQIHRFAEHRALIERLWAEGKTAREIGAVVGWPSQPNAHIAVLRNQQGYDLPHRRTPEQIARITADNGEHLRRARAARGRAA